MAIMPQTPVDTTAAVQYAIIEKAVEVGGELEKEIERQEEITRQIENDSKQTTTINGK